MSELIPTQQKEVDFYGDEVTAVQVAGEVYAVLRHVCDALGVDMVGQRRRCERHKVLNKGLMVVKVSTIQGERETYVLRVDLIPLWLSGIQTKNVKEELQPKIEKFQTEAARVLWQAFQRGELTDPLDIDQLAAAGNEVAQAYQIGQAIMSLARHQLQLQQRVSDHDRRLEALETAVSSPDRKISEAQAMEISQAVKAVAMLLSKQTKSNAYGGVYGELYRRYNITGYKQLPLSKFGDCMVWLNEWRENLESETF